MQPAETHATRAAAARPMALLWWSLGSATAAVFAAGLLLWWRFGSVIFVDLLTSLQACF